MHKLHDIKYVLEEILNTENNDFSVEYSTTTYEQLVIFRSRKLGREPIINIYAINETDIMMCDNLITDFKKKICLADPNSLQEIRKFVVIYDHKFSEFINGEC